MDISESFRPEDLSKTDFFDFVSAPPEQEGNQTAQNSNNANNNNDQPLQGFDQVSNNTATLSPIISSIRWASVPP
jgi:hypothetical protein